MIIFGGTYLLGLPAVYYSKNTRKQTLFKKQQKQIFLSFFFHILYSHLIILQDILNPQFTANKLSFTQKNLTNAR